jgi:nucleotide-binding universal stress UspA family protein
MKPSKVLVPLDGSILSRQILFHIRRMMSPEHTELLLLRVTEPPVGQIGAPPRPMSMAWTEPLYESRIDVELAHHPTYATQVWENIRAEAEHSVAEDVAQLRKEGYNVSVIIQFGDPARVIIEAAEQEKVDLIAMATHGRTGLRRLVLGSVAETVMHGVGGIPVLMVRPFPQNSDALTEAMANSYQEV